jgi:hypothetical protein
MTTLTLSPSLKAEAKAAAEITDNAKVVMKKSETHIFPGLKLKGELKKPELSYIYERKGLRSEAIVNIPENFNQEITDGAGQF